MPAHAQRACNATLAATSDPGSLPAMQWITATALAALVSISCTAHAAPAGTMRGPDRVDVDATDKIRAYTTDASFLTEWVDYLPASRTVPSPPAFLGYVIGTPDRLTRPERINEYFRALDQASDRVRVFSMGKSHGGREMIVAAVADAQVLRRLDDIKRANRELADPRVTDKARAQALARDTPAIYYITAGLHSPETGPPEMVMELAYRLAVSEQPHIQEIRKNVITLITPVIEMDGRARMVDWYYRYLTQVTDWQDSPPRMAPYWGDYTAHDNNRDGLQMSQPLTRNYVNTFHEFLPVVSLDLHESVPLLYISLGTGPYNETIDPITVTEWQWMASQEVAEATKLGLRGVWTWGFYTGWYPGYLLWVTNNHNAVGRFYETFGNGIPRTFERRLERAKYAKERVNARAWYRAWPPEKRLSWSLRNNTNYMQTAVLASLQMVARNRDKLLYNFWKKGQNSLERGKSEPPHAFHIPAAQRDRGNLYQLLWLLRGHRIEVMRVSRDATIGGRALAAGDYLVRMDQPYRNFARTLLAKQEFPKNAEHTPYDDVAWSLDYMLGVEIQPIDDAAVFGVAVEPVADVPELPGALTGQGPVFMVRHQAQTHLASLVWALPEGATVRALAEPWSGYPAGSLIVEGVTAEDMTSRARSVRVDAAAVAEAPNVATVAVDLPRVALFHTWLYTQDSGWARYTLEQLGIDYTLINKDHLRRGGLRDQFDVIIVPNQGWLSFQDMVQGIDTRWGPMPYTRTDEFPSHGVIDSSDDITGGMGFAGLGQLERFVRDGGVLVGLGSGGLLATESGLVRKARAARSSGTPGSHVTTKVLRPEHPLAWGFPELTHVFRGNLPIYDVADFDRGLVVMQFDSKTWQDAEREEDAKAGIPAPRPRPGSSASDTGGASGPGQRSGQDAPARKPPLLLSGVVKKPEELSRKPALLDIPVGAGRVILFSFNPLHRYQNHHDIPFLGNALLFYNDLPSQVPDQDQMYAREAGGAPSAQPGSTNQ